MISIITPVYNGEKFIESCINNVIEQDCQQVEHIIVDGGSTDKTLLIAKRIAENYPHIRWISEKDRGQSDAMNKGIQMAHGSVIGILNVDDFYEPNVLNHILDIFEDLPAPSLVVGNCNSWGDNGKIFDVNKPDKLDFLGLVSLKNSFPVNPAAYFYHKSLHSKIGMYALDEDYAMDIDFILRAVRIANVKYIDEIWGNYQQIQGTKTVISMQNGQQIQHLRKILKKHRKYLPWQQRWQAAFGVSVLFRMKYFTERPQELLPTLQSKISRFILALMVKYSKTIN